MGVSTLRTVVRDRHLLLFLSSTLLAIVLAFFAIPGVAAISVVSKLGFWLVLAAFAMFVHALWVSFRSEFTALGRSVDWVSVAVVGLSGTVLLVHESFGFKIVMDEIMLLGTSMSMHLDKTVLTPIRGNDIQGAFVILDGIMDKRPLFFPFLLSLLHDIAGYRPENAFVLNAILTFVFLGLVQVTGRMFGGRWVGWLGCALFAGLPLLGHNATGGGFELLNLVMILATLLLGARFLDKRDPPSLTAFCYSAVLLAQVRYESVLYVLPVAALILWVWWVEKRIILSLPVAFAPLLMVHYPLQQRIFELRSSAWELATKPGFTEPFSFRYIPENLGHALNFFFAPASEQPNSILLSLLGWLAVPFFALLTYQRFKDFRAQPAVGAATAVFAVALAAQFALFMGYFFSFDEVITRRLSLPTHLGLVLAVMAVVAHVNKPRLMRVLLIAAVVGVLTRSVPSMAAHAYSQEYLPGRETAWRRAFIAAQPRSDYLMIDNDCTLWVAHKVSSTPVLQAVLRRDAVGYHMRNRTFSNVFVFQRYMIDPQSGKMTLREGDDLGPSFVLEPVREERLQVLTLTRISRVKEIREGGRSLSTPDDAKHVVPTDRAKMEQVRKAYLENFIKKLP